MPACAECAKEFRRRAYNAEFCGGTCRRVFNNRRALRGALLYDLTMLAEMASNEAVRDDANRRREFLLKAWRKEDDRGGIRKRTWQRANGVKHLIRQADTTVLQSRQL